MNKWPYRRIFEHVEALKGRFTSQYELADKIKGFAGVFGERMQGVERALWSLLVQRWISYGEGEQLDLMGEVVGEPRFGRVDEVYRGALFARIGVNLSGGEPEGIIAFFAQVAGADNVFYRDVYPAGFSVFVDGEVFASDTERVRQVVPAGVGTGYVLSSGGKVPFGVDGINETPHFLASGFGELGTDNGGGHLAELYEV